MDDQKNYNSLVQPDAASPGIDPVPTENGGQPVFTAESSWQQHLAATNPNIYLVGSIQEFAAYLKSRDPNWTPPHASPTFFLRENYGTRELFSAGLRLVDDEWFGPWVDEWEQKMKMKGEGSKPLTTQMIRQGWRREQQRRLPLCTECSLHSWCIRHPDFRRRRKYWHPKLTPSEKVDSATKISPHH